LEVFVETKAMIAVLGLDLLRDIFQGWRAAVPLPTTLWRGGLYAVGFKKTQGWLDALYRTPAAKTGPESYFLWAVRAFDDRRSHLFGPGGGAVTDDLAGMEAGADTNGINLLPGQIVD
jgi:hypothetical protein